MKTERAQRAERGALTEREEDVLCCISEGLSNREIAHRLGITVKTVEFHLAGARRKLGLEGPENVRRFTLFARDHYSPGACARESISDGRKVGGKANSRAIIGTSSDVAGRNSRVRPSAADRD